MIFQYDHKRLKGRLNLASIFIPPKIVCFLFPIKNARNVYLEEYQQHKKNALTKPH